ncbi:hypothetical protein [Corynebacterium renale]|uniref:SWIM-type domain-containing protein n=2 Tax=Corynebacterium renale TaxID=1724 RepID=A0A2A9DN39_9CORY|nr:hypothetical protein [Corynebacterium renale]PFG27575.1 hypothetical protein ATK06_0645 [Corynebacterium renale]SQI23092.1 Uncharacterised protein [Corynebacterium renale]
MFLPLGPLPPTLSPGFLRANSSPATYSAAEQLQAGVRVHERTPHLAAGSVTDAAGHTYDVRLRLRFRQLDAVCFCPDAANADMCQHLVALGLQAPTLDGMPGAYSFPPRASGDTLAAELIRPIPGLRIMLRDDPLTAYLQASDMLARVAILAAHFPRAEGLNSPLTMLMRTHVMAWNKLTDPDPALLLAWADNVADYGGRVRVPDMTQYTLPRAALEAHAARLRRHVDRCQRGLVYADYERQRTYLEYLELSLLQLD